MSELDEVGTQPEVDVEEVVADGEVTPEPEAKPEEPFLQVNDRTVYKTREEAVRAYSQAGERIKQLSAWEKELKEYGVQDPQTAKALLNELRQLRNKQAEAAKASQASKADASLTKEEREIRDYLKKTAPEIGLVSKEDIAELKAALDALKGDREKASESEYSNAIEEGEAKLTSWLSESKIADPDGSKMRLVGSVIKDWVDSDPELIDRFWKSGLSREKLLREGYDKAMALLGWKGAEATTENPSAAHAAAKAKQVLVNKKPATDSAASRREQPPKPKGDPITSRGDKAWEYLQKMSK